MELISSLLVLLLVVIALVMGYAWIKLRRGRTFTISEAQIQKQIEKQLVKKLPIKKTWLKFFTVTLDSPDVLLERNADKIRIKLRATAAPVLGTIETQKFKLGTDEPFQTIIELETGLDYDPGKGRFYLVNPELFHLGAEHAPDPTLERFREIFNFVTREFFPNIPVYTLNEYKVKQGVTKMLLEKVEIEEGQIRVTMNLKKRSRRTE